MAIIKTIKSPTEKVEPPVTDYDKEKGNNDKKGGEYVGAGRIVLKGYGKNGGDIFFTSASDMVDWFNRLSYKKDPKFTQILAAMGITGTSRAEVLYAREVWKDLAAFSLSVSSGGKTMDAFKVYKSKGFRNYGLDIPKKYLGGGGSGGPTQQSYINITDPKDARDMLRQTMTNMLGVAPTEAEYKDFIKKLNAAEQKIFKTTKYTSTSQTTTGRMIDPKAFVERYVLKKAAFGTDLAGNAGIIQDTVNQLITTNGLNGFVTDKKKQQWMKALAKGELNNETLMANIRDEAKKVYSGFASLLDANPSMSLYEVADPYISVYANMFELGQAQVDVADVLKKAIKFGADGKESVMSVFEFEKSLRNDPRFETTKKAKDEATGLAASFARAFGVNL